MAPSLRRRRCRRARIAWRCAVIVLLGAASAHAQPTVRVRAGTRIELRDEQDAQGLTLTGSLLDDLSAPLGQRPIELSVAPETSEGAEQRRALRTAVDGTFRAAWALPPGRYRARIRFTGDAHQAASEQNRSVDLGHPRSASEPPQPDASQPRSGSTTPSTQAAPSALWLSLPLSLCGVLLWLLSRRELHERSERAAGLLVRRAGIHAADGGMRGQADRVQIGGRVLDSADERPILDATLRLQADRAQPIELAVTGAGRFSSPDLAQGRFTLTVGAPGYGELTGVVPIPHRGEWSDVQVRLASLRAAAMLAYKPAAVRALASPELWELSTPRETLEGALRRGRATESFVQLTERVERAAYARTPPDAAEVAAIERAADQESITRFGGADSHAGGSASLRARIPHRR